MVTAYVAAGGGVNGRLIERQPLRWRWEGLVHETSSMVYLIGGGGAGLFCRLRAGAERRAPQDGRTRQRRPTYGTASSRDGPSRWSLAPRPNAPRGYAGLDAICLIGLRPTMPQSVVCTKGDLERSPADHSRPCPSYSQPPLTRYAWMRSSRASSASLRLPARSAWKTLLLFCFLQHKFKSRLGTRP